MRLDTIPDDFDAPGSASRALMRSTAIGSGIAVLALTYLLSFTDHPWPELPGFVWAHAITYVIAGTVMAALLAYQAYIAGSRWMSVLAGATLFSALMYITFFLTFPDTLTDGVLLGGSQSAVWTYQLEHLGFISGLLLAAVLALLQPRLAAPRANWTAWSLALAALLSVALAVTVIVSADALPVLLNRALPDPTPPLFHTVRWTINLLALVALVLSVLAARTRSRARVWLLLATFITLAQSVKGTQADDRFTAGWYLGRLFGMVGFLLLLVVLILEVLRQARELVDRRAESLRLAQIVEQSPVAQYLADNESRIVDLNAAFTRLTGRARDDLIGTPLPVLADSGGAGLASSLLDRLRSRSTETIGMRVQLPRENQPAAWVDWTAHALLDVSGTVVGTAGSFVDAQDAVAIDGDAQVPVGDAVVSRDRQLTQANAGLCSMTGRAMAELIGITLRDLVHADDWEAVATLWDAIAAGTRTSGTVECRLRRTDGTAVWAVVYVASMSAVDGSFAGAALQLVDIDERKRAEAVAAAAQEEMAFRARYDLSTGLLNHQSLVDYIDEALRQLDRQRHVAVVVFDIDGFESVSNALTRAQGDRVLREFGQLLVEHIGSTEQVARLGADEFALAMPASDGIEVAQRVQRIMRAITDHEFSVDDRHVYLTACVGVTLGRAGMTGADLLQEADMAMRQAQRLGRGNWQMFTHTYRAEVQSRIALTHAMHEALRHDEFRAWYMPIVRLADRELAGYEALVRWHASDGVRAPDAFLKVAEETGFIIDVGGRVFDQAVRTLLELPASVRMAVNASPTQLLRGDVFYLIKALLAETGVAPQRLIVEITEQSLFETKKASDANLFQLAELGAGIHVDDFGTGYSSITHIRDFPITGLKLDTSFTARLDAGHTPSIEIAAILGELTHRLGIEGVAEGVETETQAAKLRELGWTYGQGWLFGKPNAVPQQPAAA